ncbi:diamine N-acetyltransferase [Mycobacterium frederiksbergense]|uniref:Diamine N-acetyltransferase n=1 Tax=Mycolicibacterium frederiksbergense TaxID=117567 RepID=A0ABT6L3K3_9MYCO|nr:GNAT family N-acetyltransferase [Mycolicibacterium frederiksbergense]MDH6197520.1 diamine N-acetyltransferase [Mycolicibacterium frederiksbergense]
MKERISLNMQLEDLHQDNWEEVAELEVADDQRGFMASNLYSIAQSRFLPGFFTKAVVSENRIVGFAMYGPDPDDGHIWLYRLMIDRHHQRRGLGRAALGRILQHVHADLHAPVLRLGVRPDNSAAKTLYESVGFRSTGQSIDDEEILQFEFPGTRREQD